MHLSADRSTATVVSIPRDSMTLAPPDCSATAPRNEWRMRQWNQNYAIGGAGCLIRTLEGNTGLFVDHYAVVDFRGFKQMVDALGGVKVCTPVAIDDAHTHLQLAPGTHTLDGRQALQYVRVRKSIGDGSDLQRIGRQQAFLSSVMQKATSTQLLLEPTTLYAFLTAATKSLTTDPDLGVGTMRDLAGSVKGIGLDRIQFVTVPNEPYAARPEPGAVEAVRRADLVGPARRPPGGRHAPEAQRHPVADRLAAHRLARRRQGHGAQRDRGVRARPAGRPGPRGAGLRAGLDRHRGHHHRAGRRRVLRAARRGRPHAWRRRSPARSCAGDHRPRRDGAGHPRPWRPDVVEVPNRLGSAPLPAPSISSEPEPHRVDRRCARPTPTSAPDLRDGRAPGALRVR